MKALSSLSTGRRRLAAVLVAAVLVLGAAALVRAAMSTPASPKAPKAHQARAATEGTWVASWAASPMPGAASSQATAGFSDQTVRNVIYTSVGGNRLRIQVSNAFGSTPLTVGGASVGVVLDRARLAPGTICGLTFSGTQSVTIPVGGQVLSDPLGMHVRPLEELAVSLYLPHVTGPATNHADAQQTTYVASGDHAGDTAATAYTGTGNSWYFLDGLDVDSSTASGTVVAFGDSITDGYQSEVGANRRWPNYLARRLSAMLGNTAPGVVDEGISGNRLLSGSRCLGDSGEARFERDALSQPSVRAVIVLEGINDIGMAGGPDSGCFAPNNPTVTAADIEAGYRVLITMAHHAGVRIYLGTLTAFNGPHTNFGYYGTPHGETLREQVNQWILAGSGFDGVVDFAKATQDPFHPTHLNPVYNSGDSLHPNDLGYAAMAAAVPLRYVG